MPANHKQTTIMNQQNNMSNCAANYIYLLRHDKYLRIYFDPT